jgi:hypothetical protein
LVASTVVLLGDLIDDDLLTAAKKLPGEAIIQPMQRITIQVKRGVRTGGILAA